MRVLIVEDNEAERVIMNEAFANFDHACEISYASDGEEAVRFLRRAPGFEKAPDVDFVLLDLNLPRMNGHEVLAEIKKDPSLKCIPVIILTGTCSPHELLECYANGASFCLNKPTGFPEHLALVKSLIDFVFTKVVFPDASLRRGGAAAPLWRTLGA